MRRLVIDDAFVAQLQDAFTFDLEKPVREAFVIRRKQL